MCARVYSDVCVSVLSLLCLFVCWSCQRDDYISNCSCLQLCILQVAHSHRYRCRGSGESGNMGRSKPNLRTRHAFHSWSGSYTVMLSFQPGLYDLLRTFHGFEKRTHAAHIETLSREWLSANYSIHNTSEAIHYSSHRLALTIVLGQFAWNRKCSARSIVL